MTNLDLMFEEWTSWVFSLFFSHISCIKLISILVYYIVLLLSSRDCGKATFYLKRETDMFERCKKSMS